MTDFTTHPKDLWYGDVEWTTAGGDKILIVKMATPHLKNTIAYLERRIAIETDDYYKSGCYLQGEQAVYEWEKQESNLGELNERRRAIIYIMTEELERRGERK